MDKETTFKMLMVGLLVQEQERRNAVAKARRDRIRNDPVLWAKKQEQKSLSEKRRRQRVNADPERLAIRRASGIRNSKARRERVKADPELHARERNKLNENARNNYAHRRETDPEFVAQHRARILAYNKTEKGKAIQNATQKRLRNENPCFKLAHNCRKRIWDALNGRTKWGDLYELVGCSMEDLKSHLEKQFVEGMTWDNWGKGVGKWTIDHVRPLAAHDLSDEEQQKAAFHYTNTQPMWFVDNCSKNSIVDGVKQYHSNHGVE